MFVRFCLMLDYLHSQQMFWLRHFVKQFLLRIRIERHDDLFQGRREEHIFSDGQTELRVIDDVLDEMRHEDDLAGFLKNRFDLPAVKFALPKILIKNEILTRIVSCNNVELNNFLFQT